MSYIDDFIQVSGAPPDIKIEFDKLVSALSELGSDIREAAIKIKESLFKEQGFVYNHTSFQAQDILKNRTGNCLGLPLLMGCLLEEMGFQPHYKVIVTPKDDIHEKEQEFYENTYLATPYYNPELATRNVEDPIFRFNPLEHLVIDCGAGYLLEITSNQHEFPGAESERDLTFEQALSFVFKDRAATAIIDGKYKEVIDNAKRGLKLWPDNRSIYSMLSANALWFFDDLAHDAALKKYTQLDGDDSEYHFQQFLFTGNKEHLDKSLEKYPHFAEALAIKASIMADSNPQEAKTLFATVSHLYANSQVLELENFYVNHAEILAELFGKERVTGIMKSFEDRKFGDFDYHIRMYHLTGEDWHLGEAFEAIETPMQKARFLHDSIGTEYFDPLEQRNLDADFANSRLYKDFQECLNTRKTYQLLSEG